MHANPDGCTPEALEAAADTLDEAAARYTAQETPDALLAATAAREEAKAKRDSAAYQREMTA